MGDLKSVWVGGMHWNPQTGGTNGARKTTMIVALARKLLIAMWRMVTTGEVLGAA